MTIATTVHTPKGTLVGRGHGSGAMFAGVPYAAAPVGELRFAPPRPAAGWTGERYATRLPTRAPQNPGMTEALAGQTEVEWSEDCLMLNVFTGVNARPGADLPVMVWIHGGGFTSGTSAIPWYDGAELARHDVVVVSINYRLGALGFLHHDVGHGHGGNNGILDQVVALEWVRDNIASFGGDPANVTIFGESAGGMSVGTLLAVPAARGLFGRAILQSGAGHHVHSESDASAIAEVFREVLAGAGADDPATASVEQILAAQKGLDGRVREVLGNDDIGMPFQPVIDGTTVPVRPVDAVGDGSADGVDVIAGWNADEWNLFSIGDGNPISDESLDKRFVATFGDDAADARASYVAQLEATGRNVSNRSIWDAAMTDFVFRVPAIRLLEAHAHRPGNTYGYEFGFRSTAFGGRMESCHALEIPFVFGTVGRKGVDVFLGESGPRVDELSDVMRAAWARFAHTGDPGVEGWDTYHPDERVTYGFDVDHGPAADPNALTRRLWDGRR